MEKIDSVPATLEKAAGLALQFTAAPRDYLGPATSAMKEQAALGERLAAAIRALHVTAAPQVAADERQAFENKFPGVCSHWNGQNYGDNRCQRMWEVWQARAALAAAPVQAQEQRFKEVGSFLYIGVEYVATSGDDPRGIKLYRPMVAPVQPVAVPDGAVLKKALIAIRDRCHGIGIRISDDVEKMAIAALAAPAAQGDAKDVERYRELRDGDESGDLLNFMLTHSAAKADIIDAKIDAAIAAKAAS